MTRCPLLPVGDFVALAPEAAPQRGLLISLAALTQNRGRVRAVGPDVEELEEGMLVVHRPFAVTRVAVGDAEWVLVREGDVLARLAP